MSRRVQQPNRGSTGVRANRMAKGGRVASESRVRKFHGYIGDAGEEPEAPPCLDLTRTNAQYFTDVSQGASFVTGSTYKVNVTLSAPSTAVWIIVWERDASNVIKNIPKYQATNVTGNVWTVTFPASPYRPDIVGANGIAVSANPPELDLDAVQICEGDPSTVFPACSTLSYPHTIIGKPQAQYENASGDLQFMHSAPGYTVTFTLTTSPGAVWIHDTGGETSRTMAATYLGNNKWSATFTAVSTIPWYVTPHSASPTQLSNQLGYTDVTICPATVAKSMTYLGFGGVYPDGGFISSTANRVPGDTIIGFVCGLNNVIQPSGWNILASGTITGKPGETYKWLVVQGLSDGGEPYEDELYAHYTGYTDQSLVGIHFFYRQSGYVAQQIGSTVNVGPGTTGLINYVPVGGAAVMPMQIIIMVSNTDTDLNGYEEPAGPMYGGTSEGPRMELHMSDPTHLYPVPQGILCAQTFSAVAFTWKMV